jgi:hypothetical protein
LEAKNSKTMLAMAMTPLASSHHGRCHHGGRICKRGSLHGETAS